MQDDQAPQRPYLYRAMHEWMTDCGHTPQIVVDATADGAAVPQEFVENGRIVLNVSYSATRNLELSNEGVGFQARFGGKPHAVFVPAAAVLAIYARETGEGMVFSDQRSPDDSPVNGEAAKAIFEAIGPAPEQTSTAADDDDKPPPSGGRSHLRVIK